MQMRQNERSLGELFSDLSRETSELVRKEITLAKVELTQKGKMVGKDVAYLAAGGAILFAGMLAFLATVILLLISFGIGAWFSALMVTVVVLACGAFLAMRGLESLKRANLAPQRTMETLKEDATWAKEQTT